MFNEKEDKEKQTLYTMSQSKLLLENKKRFGPYIRLSGYNLRMVTGLLTGLYIFQNGGHPDSNM